MARRPRICPAGYAQHIVQRGNNRCVCFISEGDYVAYAHWLAEGAKKYGIAIHAWVMMSNHAHLLVTPKHDNTVSLMMQYLGRQYVRRFNHVYNRTGTLWEGRYKSSLVDSDRYALACYRYIENNPVKANMVVSPGEYRWSSYHTNARGVDSAMLSTHPCYEQLAKSKLARLRVYSQLFDNPDAANLDREIQWALTRNLAAGSEKFKEEIQSLTGVAQALSPRGPKKNLE